MPKKLLNAKELEEALDITGYDIYQYSRRGLPIAQSNPSLYDLEEVKAWIADFPKREERRIKIKEKILQSLSEEEIEILTDPEWQSRYLVIWKDVEKRQEFTIKKALYLMLMHSTTSGRNMVYLSESKKEAKEIERQIQKLTSEQSKGFKSLTILDLAKEVFADKKLYLLYASDDYIINKALEILKEDAEFLEKCQLNYRKLIIEKLEKTTAIERQFIQLLDSQHTDLILNIDKKTLKQSQELREWIEGLEEIEIIES